MHLLLLVSAVNKGKQEFSRICVTRGCRLLPKYIDLRMVCTSRGKGGDVFITRCDALILTDSR